MFLVSICHLKEFSIPASILLVRYNHISGIQPLLDGHYCFSTRGGKVRMG
jgi:hypothetical protein